MLARSLILLAALLAASPPAHAAAAPTPQWQAGRDWLPVEPPQPTTTGDRIEVLEVFSYACPHCAHFQPYADQLKASLPADAEFTLMPADFHPNWVLFAQGFYAAKALGLVEQTHQAMFDAVYRDHRPMDSLDRIADFYAEHGADKPTFLSTAESFVINGQLSQAHRREIAYGIDSTPTLVVAGKYRIVANSGRNIGFAQMVEIAQYLVAREAAAKKKP